VTLTRSDEPNTIVGYMYCAQCLDELPENVSPQEYARVQAGITTEGGLQVWCNRHNCNVLMCSNLAELAADFEHSGCSACADEIALPVQEMPVH
jgi:hypothetical protein